MLLRIDPLLGPDLLHALRSMGHRHDIAIVDANFPADPTQARVIRVEGARATEMLSAVVSVLPIETDEPAGAWRMVAYDDPDLKLPVFDEFEGIIESAAPGRGIEPVAPDEFKARATASYVTVITGERRLYGGIIVRKGVVPPLSE